MVVERLFNLKQCLLCRLLITKWQWFVTYKTHLLCNGKYHSYADLLFIHLHWLSRDSLVWSNLNLIKWAISGLFFVYPTQIISLFTHHWLQWRPWIYKKSKFTYFTQTLSRVHILNHCDSTKELGHGRLHLTFMERNHTTHIGLGGWQWHCATTTA